MKANTMNTDQIAPKGTSLNSYCLQYRLNVYLRTYAEQTTKVVTDERRVNKTVLSV